MYFHPLNFIRFLLALGVLLFHYGYNYFPFNLPVLKTLIMHSSFRVSFFFFISGFVMSMVYYNKPELSASYFYKRRLTRILPLYWLAFIITVLAVVFLKGSAPKGLIIILHALGLQSWDPGYVLDLNFTTWSISVEFFFYSLFPFLIFWMRKQSTPRVLAVAFAVYIIQSVQHYLFVNYLSDGSKRIEEFISAFPLWHLGTFFSGMVCGRILWEKKVREFFQDKALAGVFVALGLFIYIIYVPNPVLRYIHNGLLTPLFALLVISLYYDRSLLHRTLSRPALSALGDLSYGLFIFQYPLWVVMGWLVPTALQANSLYLFAYIMTVLVFSYLMNRFVESPLREYLRKEKDPR